MPIKNTLKSSGEKNKGKVDKAVNLAKKLSGLSLSVIQILKGSKKNKRKASQTAETANKLSVLLNEIQLLGNAPARFPDKCLNSFRLQEELALLIEKTEKPDYGNLNPDNCLNSCRLQEELSWLIEKAERFDYDNLSPYEFVNSAISTKLYTPG